MWRSLMLLAAIGVSLAAPAAASAAPYPAPPAGAAVSSGSVTAGDTVEFSATGGFTPGEDVVITASCGGKSWVVDTVVANENGGFWAPVKINTACTAVLTATGQESGATVSRTVTVLGAGAGSGDLPVTGDSGLRLALQVGAGAVALFLGALLVWVVADRRRRQPTA